MQINYNTYPLENDVQPTYLTGYYWNAINVDTTSLTYPPGRHTIKIKAIIFNSKTFVIWGYTDETYSFVIAFTCLMTPTTTMTEINH